MSRKIWISVVAVVTAVAAVAMASEFWRSDPVRQKKLAQHVNLVIGVHWIPATANVVLAKEMGFSAKKGWT